GSLKRIVRGQVGTINKVRFTPDGSQIVTASSDRTVRTWDAEGGLEALLIPEAAGGVHGLAWGLDGTLLAVGGFHGVRLRDARRGRLVRELPGNPGALLSLDWERRADVIAVGSASGVVRVSEAGTGKERFRKEYRGSVRQVVFRPGGRLLG